MDLMIDLMPAGAEIFLLVMTCVILIADLTIRQNGRLVTYMLVQFTLLGCSLITVGTHGSGVVYAFNNMYVDDLMSDVLKLLTYLAVSMMLVYSRLYLTVRGLFSGEFMALALFATLGMMVMISANHFLTLYLGLELLSLSLYAMVALQRDSAIATEAAMKYFILGALASGLLLYGMSMLYGATGSLELGAVANAIQSGAADKNLLVFGLVFVVSGLAFKLG
ncbi:MAG: NADH:ubiquinone oxidoreductase subunit N, partial [Gallionella sp.]